MNDFAPCARIAYNFSKTWAVAVEEYADFGVTGGSDGIVAKLMLSRDLN